MKHYKLVLPEFMNEQGVLFGGYLLHWIDELAYITASLDHPRSRFVTIALDNVTFKKPIHNGDILCFDVVQCKKGRTSVEYMIKVTNDRAPEETRDTLLFETKIVFVNVDLSGKPQPITDEKAVKRGK